MGNRMSTQVHDSKIEIFSDMKRKETSKRNDKLNAMKKRLEKKKVDDLMTNMMNDLDKMIIHETQDNTLASLTKATSDWGHCQHHPDTPFIGKKGYVIDLETFWSNKGWSYTYIQEIGACPIGLDDENFEILCDIDYDFNDLADLKAWISSQKLDVQKSLGCWKKVLKVNKEEDIIKCLKLSREWLKSNEIKDYSMDTMKKMKHEFKSKMQMPLVFSLESALFFFVNYFKKEPVWYAHNGNKFDYPILEKAFHSKGIPYSCVPKGNAPGKTTTSMNGSFRTKFNLPLKKNEISCYDTMWMMRQHPQSKYKKRGYGALRVSQGERVGYEVVNRSGKTTKKIVWKNGDRTADEYSYKLQDIVNDVGMKANDITAHTALADCLTLRECLYRVFSSKSLEEIRDCAKSALKDVEKSKLYKITKRLKF